MLAGQVGGLEVRIGSKWSCKYPKQVPTWGYDTTKAYEMTTY